MNRHTINFRTDAIQEIFQNFDDHSRTIFKNFNHQILLNMVAEA